MVNKSSAVRYEWVLYKNNNKNIVEINLNLRDKACGVGICIEWDTTTDYITGLFA